MTGIRPGFWAVVLIGVSLCACSGSGAGLDASGRPLAPGGGTNGALTADFDSIQSHVFTPICTVCHAGAGAPQGLRLDSTNSYSLLVGVPSTEVPSIDRVATGDPDNSYLIQKLEGHAAVGAQMPFGGPPLTADVIAVIRQWITDGAQRPIAPTGVVVHAFAMSTVVPASGDLLSEPPAVVMIEMNKDIDATRIDGDSVRIERSPSDSAAADIERLPVRIVMPAANPRALLVAPVQSLGTGHYRLVLRGGSGTSLGPISGESLQSAAPETVISEFDVESTSR